MKTTAILLSITLLACGVIPEPESAQWCYLYAAMYLIHGDLEVSRIEADRVKHLHQRFGCVEAAFNRYNTDPNLELYHSPSSGVSRSDVKRWLARFRVAIRHGQHVEPLVSMRQYDGAAVNWIYVVGDFNS